MLKRVVGALMLTGVFAALVILLATELGYLKTLAIFGLSFGTAAVITVGIKWVLGD